MRNLKPGIVLIRPVASGGAGGACALPLFGRSVNPISTRGGTLSPPSITCHPGFTYLATALNCDMSKNKASEELCNVVEELPFDSFFPGDNFENTSDESERMCNLNTLSSKNEDCDYSFSQNDDLKTHTESVHEEKKVFQCEICKSCTQTDNMKNHLNFFLGNECNESQFENRFNLGKDKIDVIIPKKIGLWNIFKRNAKKRWNKTMK